MGVFEHAVASGDPLPDRVVIWTRLSHVDAPTPATWRVATDPGLEDVVAEGEATSDPDRDHTVHVDVEGLRPATSFHYAFEALGERSPVGRTRTLPGPDTKHVRFAVCSCAKHNAGYFNAYARMAERDDLDFVLHLGDYIYEVADKPPPSQFPGADIGRPFFPLHECVSLEDYRVRYAQYRRDPDVQRLHLAHPVIATVDDHEFADGSWRGGAVEHREDRDGPWDDRVAAAFRSRWEWQPYRMPDPSDPGRVWQTIKLGDLADIFLIDTRTLRDEPVGGEALLDPGRTQLGSEQRSWLLREAEASTAAWRLLANGSVMAHTWMPGLSEDMLSTLRLLKLAAPDVDGPDADQWDGYPIERDAILTALRAESRDLVVLSGDIHVGMVLELRDDPLDPATALAPEFVTASLTSQNVDEKKGWAPRTGSIALERAVIEGLPHIRWADLDSHGFMVVDVDMQRVRAEWWFVDTVLEPSSGIRCAAVWEVDRGSPVPREVSTGSVSEEATHG